MQEHESEKRLWNATQETRRQTSLTARPPRAGAHALVCAVTALMAVVLPVLATGCAGTRPESLQAEAGGRISLEKAGGFLGEVTREIGEELPGGLVLMNGVEERVLGEISLSRATSLQLAQELARQTGLTVEETPHYHFLYPPGYENLTRMAVASQLDPAWTALRTGVSFGAGTRLYNILGAMSHNLGKTIIADNIVADSECGELFIHDAPLGSVLEAVMKSARVYPDAIVVENTADYIFIRSVQNNAGKTLRVPTDQTHPGTEELLARRVTVYLPERPAEGLTVYRAALPLSLVLAPLTEQLGVPVSAAKELEDLPVNFTVFHDLPAATVLELLIRQWPVNAFGYEARPGGIHIVRR